MNLRLVFKSGAVVTIPLKEKLRTASGVPYEASNSWAELCIQALGTGSGTAQQRREINDNDLAAYGLKVDEVVYWDVG